MIYNNGKIMSKNHIRENMTNKTIKLSLIFSISFYSHYIVKHKLIIIIKRNKNST